MLNSRSSLQLRHGHCTSVCLLLPLLGHYAVTDLKLSSQQLKTSSALGVVTAFITMSDVKDELDVEMPGASKDGYQSNLFNMGVAN